MITEVIPPPSTFKGIIPTKQADREHVQEIIDSISVTGFEPFSRVAAKRICSKHNKDFRALVVGEPGAGKSWTLLYLAQKIAEEVARMKGGDPSTYFNMTHIAVITAEDIIDRMNNLEKFHVYILDDAGVAWDSRDFASKGNKTLNHILQTCRTANAAILISVPDPKLIDVAVTKRGLIQYWIEVSESLHDYGKNLVKVFRLKRMFRKNEVFHMYPRYGDNKIVRYESGMPTPDVVTMYEEVRERNRLDASCKYDDKEKVERKAKKEQEAQDREEHFMMANTWVMEDHMTQTRAVARLNAELKKDGKDAKYHPATFSRWRVMKGYSSG